MRLIRAWVLLCGVVGASAAIGGERSPRASEYRKLSFRDATCGSVVPLPIEFTIPADYVALSAGESTLNGCLWGTPKDLSPLSRGLVAFDFSKIERGVFWARLSLSVAYDPEEDRFTGEETFADEFKKAGGENGTSRRTSLAGYPAQIITGSLQGKLIYVLYLSLKIDTNVLQISYRTPPSPGENDAEIWRRFVEGVRLTAVPPREISGSDASGAVPDMTRALQASAFDAAFRLECVVGPAEARKRPRILQKVRLKRSAREVLQLTNELEAASLLEIKNGNRTDITNFQGPWSSTNGRFSLTHEGNMYVMRFGADSREVWTRDAAEVLDGDPDRSWLMSLLGSPYLSGVKLSTVLEKQLALFDLKRVGLESGRLVLMGNIRRDRLADALKGAPGVDDNSVSDCARRLSFVKVLASSDGARFERLDISGKIGEETYIVSLVLERFVPLAKTVTKEGK